MGDATATGAQVGVASQSSPTQSPDGDGEEDAVTVDLRGCALSALPPDVCARLPAVRALLLSQNLIGELPAVAWSSLGELLELDLSDNRLSSLPSDGLRALRSLRVLRLARQRGPKGERILTELPDALGGLPRLEELDVRGNALTELPAGLADGALRALHAADNPLLLRLPDEAGERLHGERPSGEADALFCDPDFPANASSLFRDPHVPWRGHPPPERVRWLRPAEICAQVCDGPPPALFVDGAASTDVVQAEAMR